MKVKRGEIHLSPDDAGLAVRTLEYASDAFARLKVGFEQIGGTLGMVACETYKANVDKTLAKLKQQETNHEQ